MAGATCKNTRIIIIIPSSPMNCSVRETTPASSSTQETKEQELPKLRTSGTKNVSQKCLEKYLNFSISQEDVPIGKKNQLGVCGSRETKERSLMKLFCKLNIIWCRPHITWLKDGIELNSFSEHEHVSRIEQLSLLSFPLHNSSCRYLNGKSAHTNWRFEIHFFSLMDLKIFFSQRLRLILQCREMQDTTSVKHTTNMLLKQRLYYS